MFVAKSTFNDQIAGLFTAGKIKTGEFIMDYTGKLICEESSKEMLDAQINDMKGRSYGFTIDS